MSSTRSDLPWQNCAERNGLFLSVGQQGHHVQPNGICDVQDWKRLAAVIREVLWRQVVRTLEHNQTRFKLDTLVDWQPVKEITHRRGNTIRLPADYQSSCGVEDSLQLPQVDRGCRVHRRGRHYSIVDPVDNSSIHQSLDSVSCQCTSDHTNLPQSVETLTREASDVVGERKFLVDCDAETSDVAEEVDS